MAIVRNLDHLVLTVRDMSATIEWYTTILEFEERSFAGIDGSLRTALHFGTQKINIHPLEAPIAPHALSPTPASSDLCFLLDVPLGEMIRRLAALDVPIEIGPVARTGATGPIRSIYVRDPDGNLIELSETITEER